MFRIDVLISPIRRMNGVERFIHNTEVGVNDDGTMGSEFMFNSFDML